MCLLEICEVCHADGFATRKTAPTKYAGWYRFSLCPSTAQREWRSAFGAEKWTNWPAAKEAIRMQEADQTRTVLVSLFARGRCPWANNPAMQLQTVIAEIYLLDV